MSHQPPEIDRALVDFDTLIRWMDAEGVAGGSVFDVIPITSGTQNLMFRFTRGGRTYVLRRPPQYLRPHSNASLEREIRVLTALRATAVPTPTIVAGCMDPTIMGGANFYLMEFLQGFDANVALPALHASDERVRRQMGLNAARAIATLGQVDHIEIGLAGLGRPEGFLDRQVDRWLSELDSYSLLAGYPGPKIPGVDRVAEWLRANQPASWRPGVMHGDYHVSNIMFAPDGPRVAAIVDWEMTTIGDPLLDLGWLLATWPAAGERLRSSALGSAGGLATREELVAEYARHSTRDLSSIDWYRVLACFKLGVVLEGTHARAFAGLAPVETGDWLHQRTLDLFKQANAII